MNDETKATPYCDCHSQLATLEAENKRLREALTEAYEDYIKYNDCSGSWDHSEGYFVLVEHSDNCLKCKMEAALNATQEGKG